MTPDAELCPMVAPEAAWALEYFRQTTFPVGSLPLLEAPASEVMVRIARRQAELYWRRVGCPGRDYTPHLYRNLRRWCELHRFSALATWHTAFAHYATEGIPPGRYAADVIRRARGHARNVARGRPWLKQR
jgi:hypothetical protein